MSYKSNLSQKIFLTNESQFSVQLPSMLLFLDKMTIHKTLY